jgi:SAM-dependent methyltransferase
MKLYADLASWWPLLSAPEEYAEESAEYIRLLETGAERPVRTVLELGSGGGNNASHLKRVFALTLVEPSDGMRDVSLALNPECEHVAGDMRTVRLGRTFDAVFVHDAVAYMTTEADLGAAIETAAAHLSPGGVALFAPDETAEAFRSGASSGGHDGPNGRGLRYLQWSVAPQPGATCHEEHFALLLRERDGSVHAEHDVHRCGIFPRAIWLRLLAEAGLRGWRDVRHLSEGDDDVFLGVRPR